MNVQKEEKVEDSLELLMRGEERAIVEDSFEKIQEQEQYNNEEEEVSKSRMKVQLLGRIWVGATFRKRKTSISKRVKGIFTPELL